MDQIAFKSKPLNSTNSAVLERRATMLAFRHILLAWNNRNWVDSRPAALDRKQMDRLRWRLLLVFLQLYGTGIEITRAIK